jgi:hypothetical protein
LEKTEKYSWEILAHPQCSPDLAPSKPQLFWDLARSYKGLALQEKITIQEVMLKSLQNVEMDINHSDINKLVQHWQKFWGHKRNFTEKWQTISHY